MNLGKPEIVRKVFQSIFGENLQHFSINYCKDLEMIINYYIDNVYSLSHDEYVALLNTYLLFTDYCLSQLINTKCYSELGALYLLNTDVDLFSKIYTYCREGRENECRELINKLRSIIDKIRECY